MMIGRWIGGIVGVSAGVVVSGLFSIEMLLWEKYQVIDSHGKKH